MSKVFPCRGDMNITWTEPRETWKDKYQVYDAQKVLRNNTVSNLQRPSRQKLILSFPLEAKSFSMLVPVYKKFLSLPLENSQASGPNSSNDFLD